MSDTPKDTAPPPDNPPPAPAPEKLKPQGVAAMQGEAGDSASEWKDLGIVDVPVASLPAPEGVNGPQDFNHHIKYDDAISAAKQLPEVEEQMKAGKTKDDLWREDQASVVTYGAGKERVYDLFYGSDPVMLEKVGDNYTILSGRHRIYAAKEVGLKTIPAHVKEKQI